MSASPTTASPPGDLQQPRNLRGIACMLASQALFAVNDTIVKLAAETLPTGQIMALRGLIAITLIAALCWLTGAWRGLPLTLAPLPAARAGLEAVLAGLYIAALPHLTLGDITTILQATPLVLTALSAWLLAEAVGIRRWLAVIVGFAGVVIVMRPTFDGVDGWALVAFLVAVLIAFRDLVTRRLPAALPTLAITLTTNVTVCALGFGLSAFEDWQAMTAELWTMLAAAAVLVTSAVYTVILAFRDVEVSVVSPFRYIVVVWAMVLGYLVWGDRPDLFALIGAALIVGAGLYTLHRETVRRRLHPARRIA